MTCTTYFRAQAYNNAWSNHRLLSACGELSLDELHARRTSFFPSIVHTLNHILIVDWFYVSSLEGDSMGPAAFEPEVPCPEFADLDREQRAIDQRLIALCESLSDAGVREPTHMDRGKRVQTERKDRTLLHLFQHQVHHRGQVHAMLAGTRIDPPQLDEFFMGDAKELALRKDDFAALAFEEEMIWRD